MPASAISTDTSRRLILWLPLAYILISGFILAVLLVQLRQQAMETGRELLQSFARLADEQTNRTVLEAAVTLQALETKLNTPGGVSEPEFSNRLRDSLTTRPFFKSIWVLDEAGKVVHGAGGAFPGDHSDQPYFIQLKTNPYAGLEVMAQQGSQASGESFVPVAKAWLRPDSSVAGVIVVALEPRYFVHAWTPGPGQQELTVAMHRRRDGDLLMRIPYADDAMERSFADDPLFTRHLPAASAGTYEVTDAPDGRDRLLSYRTLGGYPYLLIVVDQPFDQILAGWHRTTLIVIAGWIAASAALAAMTYWLMREWARRQSSEERYRLLFDANPHPLAVFEPDSLRILAINQAAVLQYGWSHEEFLGMTLADFQPPEDLPRLHDITAEPTPDAYRMRHWRKDGSRFETESTVKPITFDGRPAMLVLAQDVTERNLMRSRLIDAVQAFPGSFRLFDSNERLVLCNDVQLSSSELQVPTPEVGASFETMARYSADNELDVAAVGRREEWLAERLAQFRRGNTDVEVQWRDGRWFQLLERRTSDGGTISLRLDITARKAVEEQLRQAQKMEAIGQLTGGVAHDLNNMLTVIIGNTEALLDREALDADMRDTLGVMLRAADGSAELTNRLLAFARRQPLRPKTLDVNEFVSRMDGLLRSALGEQVQLAFAQGSDLWPINIDPGQLEAAILNLAINARDAMPGGGRLTIGTGNAIVDGTYAITHRDLAIGEYVVVAISDTGVGMSPETVARAFEPFFTTKEVGKGTGLGLSMVYGFARQSGGHVTIYSEQDEGTTVRMYLPRASANATATDRAEASRPPMPSARGESILLVEDDELVRGHVAAQLAQLGYRVIQASDGRQAVAVLTGDAIIDLLFTDMVMPGGIGGRELAEQARRLRPGIRTLFTTGYSADAVAHAGRIELDAPLLSKPYRLGELANHVRHALNV